MKKICCLFLLLCISTVASANSMDKYLVGSNPQIFLSEDDRLMADESHAIVLLPKFSFISKITMTRTVMLSASDLLSHISDEPNEASKFLDMMSDIATPLSSKYLDTDEDFDTEDIFGQPTLYADISSAMISYFLRYLTKNTLDIVLLTPDLDEDSEDTITGIEFGVRLTPTYGFRLKFQDNNTAPMYGMQFEFFPDQNTVIRFIHEDNETETNTGIEVKLNF